MRSWRIRDHPRVGGEKSWKPWERTKRPGSPPRGRGKEFSGAMLQPQPGITPAWAGKSRTLCGSSDCQWDHPRVGGEKMVSCRSGTKGRGSPPRGRGKVQMKQFIVHKPGITPAWAGKSRICKPACPRPEDHPRVGGEKFSGRRGQAAGPGSPPRGRGKACCHAQLDNQGRITPAWAGKRTVAPAGRHPDRDHPRVGGEKTKKIP